MLGQLRIGMGLPHGLYVAIEGEAGGVTDGGADAEMMSGGERGAPELTATHVAMFGGLAVAGARTRIGSLDLGVEAAGGAHLLVYGYESHYFACDTSTSLTEVMPALEARGRAALWLTPFLSVDVTAGKSVIDRAWMGGVSFGFSSKAFGGRYVSAASPPPSPSSSPPASRPIASRAAPRGVHPHRSAAWCPCRSPSR